MDDGDLDLSSQILLPNLETAGSFEEFLKNTRTCTHTHTCNPPGPAAEAHTHTCLHTHAQVFTATGQVDAGGHGDDEEAKKSRKSLGNREAVRKYREKKKAHAAYLEEEVKKLRLANQELLRRLQGQATLEAEGVRLRSLLANLRAKIDAELGAFPSMNQCSDGVFRCSGNAGAVVDCQMNSNGDAAQELEIPEAANSMDVVGSLVSSDSWAEYHQRSEVS